MAEIRVELPFTPFHHQRLAHQLRLAVRFLVLVWHRRAGKTVFAVVELILAAAVCTRERGRFAYVAPFLKQGKAVAWEYLKAFTQGIPGRRVNEGELYVELPNGAQVRVFGADNPDGLRGLYFDGLVMDEVADMKPDVWGLIIRPALADRGGWALFIGTPKGVNLFSELYHRALKGEDGWASDLRRASDTGVISAEELEQMRREMSPAQFAQENECDFAAAVDDVLLRLDDVLAAQRREVARADYEFAGRVLGVDPARYGSDRSVIFPRQGLAAMKPVVMRGLDSMALADRVLQAMERFQPDAVFIDGSPASYGVIDRLRQLGRRVVPVDFGGRPLDERFENRKAEMWWLMAAWVRDGGALPEGTELAQDLTAPRYTYANARGKLQLESKDNMRGRGLPSPDLGDALALTFAAPVVRRSPFAAVAEGHDYHPLERFSR